MALASEWEAKTLADQLPYSFTYDEFLDILQEWPVVQICWPPQTLKSVAVGLLSVSAMILKKSVMGFMGINSTMALMGLYHKITSEAPNQERSRYTGVMHRLGLENTVKMFKLGTGSNSALDNFFGSMKISQPSLLLTPANAPQIAKIVQKLADARINKKQLVVFVDEVHSLFELVDNNHQKILSKALLDFLFTVDESGK